MKLARNLRRSALLVTISTITMGVSAVGAAAASPVKSIQTILSASPVASAPFSGTASGTYAAFGASGTTPIDSGPIVAQFIVPAPPPKATQIETFRTISNSSGDVTLKLHCSEIAKPGAPFTNGTTTGSCAVLSASGPYAGLTGHGTLTGQLTGGTPTDPIVTLTDTIVF
jgi:hypothetical protein